MSTKASDAAGRLATAVRAAPAQLLGGTVSVASSRQTWSSVGMVVPFTKKKGKKRRRKGGDDASAPAQAGGGDRSANGRVYLAAYPQPGQSVVPVLMVAQGRSRKCLRAMSRDDAEAITLPTTDPHDRAHETRDESDGNFLASAAGLGPDGATPRRYPPSHFNGRGVALDSSFDELHERLKWLEREVGEVAGMGVGSASSNQREAVRGLALKRSAEGRRR